MTNYFKSALFQNFPFFCALTVPRKGGICNKQTPFQWNICSVMLEVQKIHCSHLLLPSPEVRSWYPKQDFSFCQIQSPPHYLGNRLCCVTLSPHLIGILWPMKPLHCFFKWKVSAPHYCVGSSLSLWDGTWGSLRAGQKSSPWLSTAATVQTGKGKDKQGEGRVESAQSNSFNTSGWSLSLAWWLHMQ